MKKDFPQTNRSWLIFDMGGVLMNHNIPACIKRFQEILGDNYPKLGLEGNGEGTGLMEKFEKGLVGDDEFVASILKYSMPGTSNEDIIKAWNLMHADIPRERISMLRKLKAAGYRLGLLSNSNVLHWKDICDNYDLDGIFEHTFLSFAEHCTKPDRQIFRIVEERTGASPSELTFIDDLEANRKAAQELGWSTYCSIEELYNLLSSETSF